MLQQLSSLFRELQRYFLLFSKHIPHTELNPDLNRDDTVHRVAIPGQRGRVQVQLVNGVTILVHLSIRLHDVQYNNYLSSHSLVIVNSSFKQINV